MAFNNRGFAGWSLALAFVLATGCSTDPHSRVVGAWSGSLDLESLPPIPVPGVADQLKDAMGTALLKLRSDNTFMLSLGPAPAVKGKWELDGTNLTLTPDAFAGKPQTGGMQIITTGTFDTEFKSLTVEQTTPFGAVKLLLRKTA